MDANVSQIEAEIARLGALDSLIQEVSDDFKARQNPEGEWLFELEPDATITAEYIFLRHFLDDLDGDYAALEPKLASFLRRIQCDHGGWALFHDGDINISASVKAYWALKLAGDDPDAPHMVRAREAIRAVGGAAQCNVFTRIAMALFGHVPWRAVPVMPIQIMLLPQWFPFHLSKISYWSRTVLVPLLILQHLKPRARNPRGVTIEELFLEPPEVSRYPMNATASRIGALFVGLDKVLQRAEPLLARINKDKALEQAVDFVTERLNGEDGLGGIFPAMANSVMALDTLGYRRDHPHYVTAMQAIDRLLVHRDEAEAYCQPCFSPIWDTCLGMHALLEAGEDPEGPAFRKAEAWLLEREITETAGDWQVRRPGLAPGGWAFQYRNDHYPDVDDTAVVALALDRAGNADTAEAVKRAAEWIIGMQSREGGWGAFEPENTHLYLNHIPFADHGALLDPPTVDVTARCLSMLAQLGYGREHSSVRRAIDFIKREQEADGSWHGRWGVNYIYGTWSALAALNAAGEDMSAPYIRKAVDWLKAQQRFDGGWGEDCATYEPERRGEAKASTPSQTAWALLGLMAAGEAESEVVRRGIEYLQLTPRKGGRWVEKHWTGTGFPQVFMLNYHGYAAYFPLWALARYRNLMRGNSRAVAHGM
jgi:squalene-hopene/tetraprenyl-beta-curcumene cyclase